MSSVPAPPASLSLESRDADRRGGPPARRGLAPRWDPLRLQLGLLMVVVLSRLHQHLGVVAKFRPALVLALGALVYAYLNPRHLAAGTVLRSPLARVVLALLMVACLSVPFAISVGNSGRMVLFGYSKLIIIVILTMLAIRTVSELFSLIWAYVIGVGVLASFATFVFKLEQGKNLARLNDLYTWDANDAGLIFVTGLPLAVLVAQSSRGGWKRLAWLLVALIGVATIRTGSRGAFLGLLAVGVGVLFLARAVSASRRLALVLVAVVGFLVFAPADYRNQMRTLLSPTEDYSWTSTQGRKELAKRGLGYMVKSPFGIGIDNFSKAECSNLSWWFRYRNPLGGGVKCSAPHNTWVQAGAETGVIGFVAWAAMILGSFAVSLRLSRSTPKAWRAGTSEERFLALGPGYLATAVLGFAVSSTFVSFAWQELAYLLTAFVVGIAGLHANARAHTRALAPAEGVPARRRRG